MAESTEDRTSLFERHAQTVLAAAILAILAWAGVTLSNLSVSVAQLTERVTALQNNMTVLQGQTADRYTRQDAVRDLTIVQKSLEDHTQRLRALEAQSR